jgi:large subunit ribosomal protein L18
MSRSTPQEKRIRNKRKIRAAVSGTEIRPRLSVFRSNNYMSAQLINDVTATTIASVNHMDDAVKAGEALAKAAQAKGIKAVVFDRNGFKYAGRIKAFADAAHEGGLEF